MKTQTTALLLATGTFTAAALPAATEETFAKTFPAAAGGSLVVDVDFGSLEIIAEPARTEVKVDVWRKITRSSTSDEEAYLKENPVTIAQDGATVTIRARGSRLSGWNLFSFWRNQNEARYTVHVPEKFAANLKTNGGGITATGLAGSLQAGTSGGGLRFTGIHGSITGHTSGGGIKAFDCEGEIRLDTSGGGIEVGGGGGDLRVGTSGGGITVKTFAGPAWTETSGGGITIENVRGKIHGATSGGPIHALLLSPLPGDVDLATSGGGIHVTVPAEAAFNLDAGTSGGGVHCDLPLTVQGKLKSDRAVGTVNGGGPCVRLHTSGGGVHVQKG